MTSAVPTGYTRPPGVIGTPGVCTLGDLTFRIGPSQIAWEYHMDATVINTIGGRVVQVYGATLGDLTVQGLFGARYRKGSATPVNDTSMEQARAFAVEIEKMVDAQGERPTNDQLTRKDKTPMNPPLRMTYTGDGVHQWDFSVYIKGLSDLADPQFAVSHKTGKYSYGYQLTLFIVEDHTGELTQISTDDFITRLSEGIGWQKTTYNGPMTKEELQKYLADNSPDGTMHKLVLKAYEDAAKGKIPDIGTMGTNPIPGLTPTAQAAEKQGLGQTPPAPAAPGAAPAAPPKVPKPGDPNFVGPVKRAPTIGDLQKAGFGGTTPLIPPR